MKQQQLFRTGTDDPSPQPPLPLRPDQLRRWQLLVAEHQQNARRAEGRLQGELFAVQGNGTSDDLSPVPPEAGLPCGIDPFRLPPQPLNFWRWPDAPQQGAAHYFVVDGASHLPHPLLLYVGETGEAARRWKGDHDCKGYLSVYAAVLQAADLAMGLSIRFWCDAPAALHQRRAQEQQLIQHWCPPFNREMQDRWQTPFTALKQQLGSRQRS